jgi:ectoine hydroxylase-related dioxygenase (phytanoyl-CoA dioxygenase family)
MADTAPSVHGSAQGDNALERRAGKTSMPATLTTEELFDATPLLDRPAELKARAHDDGYLFFRGLLPAERVLDVRRAFVRILEKHGWLKPGTDPMDAVAWPEGGKLCSEGDEGYWPLLDAFQRLENFHALAHDPQLLHAMKTIFEDQVLVHPRHIGRLIQPGTRPTPPHQDYTPIRGTFNTWTAWVPLGDVPRRIGGLAVLERSHTRGHLPFVPMPGAGGAGIEEHHLEGRWLGTDFKVGDVLVFHSLNIHRGLPAREQNLHMRLSCDFRYQPVKEKVNPDSLLPHFGRMGWDEIYRGWKSDRYQYYWTKYNLVEEA